MNKYLVGSTLLNLDNVKDTDVLIVVDSEDDIAISKEDRHFITKTQLENRLRLKLPSLKEALRYYMVNYQFDRSIIGSDFPIEYHILDYREQYIELLNWTVDHKAIGFDSRGDYNSGIVLKYMYHVAYTAFIMKNNSTTITPEQKAIIQKIHDRQMPQSYLEELAAMIKDLK